MNHGGALQISREWIRAHLPESSASDELDKLMQPSLSYGHVSMHGAPSCLMQLYCSSHIHVCGLCYLKHCSTTQKVDSEDSESLPGAEPLAEEVKFFTFLTFKLFSLQVIFCVIMHTLTNTHAPTHTHAASYR